LRPKLKGETFNGFGGLNASTFRPSVVVFQKQIKGKKLEDIHRYGKYIIFDLSDGLKMIVHLRMTGMLTLAPMAGKEKFLRGIFRFKSGKTLYFSDIRKFGKIYLFEEKNYLINTGMHKLGIDPILSELLWEDFKKLFYGKKGILKNKLLDQTIIAGIGNIYADEICFRSGLRPSCRVEGLSVGSLKKVLEAINFCLEQGIRNNGTTISDFVNAQGNAGRNQEKLVVYGRAGLPCRKCASPILKTRSAGRGTYYCPKCQK
jgi:formamidopyrimidine-DNA glycosylase